MRTAIVHATLIIVLTVTPVFFMGGLGGSFFAPLALAYFIAMFSSMVVALTVTPALCFMLVGRRSIQQRESPLLPPLKRAYQALLSRAVRTPRTVYAGALVVVIAGLGVFPFLGHTLLPTFKERDFLMHWVPPEGTSHPETVRITQQASREFRAIPGVRNFGAHIGRAVAGDEPYGVNFTENWISVDRAVDYDKTRATIEAAVASYPGLYRDVQTYLQERIKEVLTGAGESIVIRIFGPELSVMRAKAREVEAAIKDIPGLVDLHVEQQVNVPQIQITTNLETAARHGLKPGDVRRAAAVLMTGVEVTDIHRDAKVYDVFVWSPPEVRGSVDAIREFPIDTAYGGRVRLGEVAEVAVAPTPNKIRRENSSRRLDVHANVRGRDLGSVVPARRVQGAPGGADESAHRRRRRGDRDLPPAADDLPQLAARGPHLPRPSRRAGRRPAREFHERPCRLARLPGRDHHGPGHRGAEQHHAPRALPASRARRG